MKRGYPSPFRNKRYIKEVIVAVAAAVVVLRKKVIIDISNKKIK
jgi:hypothetical protein